MLAPNFPMVVYNAATRELTAKIVYYGPGLCGKTTNLQVLHDRLEPSTVGKLLNLSTHTDRTIYFDLLPVELGDIKGYKIRFQLATVPGQTAFNETRRVVLKGADGIVFVADSQWTMLPKNLECWQNLKDNLKGNGVAFEGMPVVVQYNKRDLSDILSVDAMQEALGLSSYPFVEAVASAGRGVTETFKLISKLTFVDLLRRLQGRRPEEASLPAPSRDEKEEESLTWKESLFQRVPEAGPARPRPLAPVPSPSDEAPFAEDEAALPEAAEVGDGPFGAAATAESPSAADSVPPLPRAVPLSADAAVGPHPEEEEEEPEPLEIVAEVELDDEEEVVVLSAEAPALARESAPLEPRSEIAPGAGPPPDARPEPHSSRELEERLAAHRAETTARFQELERRGGELEHAGGEARSAIETRLAALEERIGADGKEIARIAETLSRLEAASGRLESAFGGFEEAERRRASDSTRLDGLEQAVGAGLERLGAAERRLAADVDRLDAQEKRTRAVEDDAGMALSTLTERTENLQNHTNALQGRLSEIAEGIEALRGALDQKLDQRFSQANRESEDIRSQLAPLLDAHGHRHEQDERLLSEIDRLRDGLADSLADLAEQLRRAVRGLGS